MKKKLDALFAEDPSARLHLLYTFAIVVGHFGLCFAVFSFPFVIAQLFGACADFKPTPYQVFEKSFGRVICGYGAAIIIRAIAVLYKKESERKDQ